VDEYDGGDGDGGGGGDAIKRQRKGEGQIISDHSSDVPQVQGDVTTMYVLYIIANYDILNGGKFC
jgi:hypothetical protein